MDHDEKPLPTTQNRRRSLFDEECQEETNQETFKSFPEERSGIYYPREYIEKVRTEIEQWETHIEKTLEENKKFKKEKMELKNKIVDENALSAEQHEFFDSINIEGYMKRVKDFCDRATIFMDVLRYEPETETEQWCRAAQKIEHEIMEKHIRE